MVRLLLQNNTSQEQQQQQRRRQQPFWSHPAHWREGKDGNVRSEGRQQQTSLSPAAAGSIQSSSPSVVPWSPWSPPGRRGMITSSSSASLLREPLLTTTEELSPRSLHYDEEVSPEAWMGTELNEEHDQERTSHSSCCAQLCCCCCFWCCNNFSCCKSPRSRRQAQSPSSRQNTSSFSEEAAVENQGETGGDCRRFLLLLLGALMFGTLLHISGKGNNQHWTMTAGESRRVETAAFGLTDTVQVISHSPVVDENHKDDDTTMDGNHTITRGMAVYAMNDPHCPLLTGPPIVVDGAPQQLVLFQHAWEYQFFYLNEGSTMQVAIRQTEGATNILVLRGNKVLARIQDKKKEQAAKIRQQQFSDVALDFDVHQIMFERFSWTQERSPVDFSFTSPASDVYVILFDNAAASEAATLQVTYHMNLTTYNLDGLVPWCSHSSPPSREETSFTCPPLEVSKAGCIIVEALMHSSSGGGDNNNNNSSSSRSSAREYFAFGQEVVQVTLISTRKWTWIGVSSVLPSLVIALYLQHRRKKKLQRLRRRYYRRAQLEENRRQTAAARTRSEHFNQQQPIDNVFFHYLPTQQDSDHEEEHAMEEQSPMVDIENNSGDQVFPEATAASPDNGSTSGETTIVPAENVILLHKERNEGEEAQLSSS